MTVDIEFVRDLADNDLAYRLARLSHRVKGDDRLVIQEAVRRLLSTQANTDCPVLS